MTERSLGTGQGPLILTGIGYGFLVMLGPIRTASQGAQDWRIPFVVLLLLISPGVAMCLGSRYGYYIVTVIVVLQLVGSFLASCIMLLLVLMNWLAPKNVSVDTTGLESWTLGKLAWYNVLVAFGYAVLTYALFRQQIRTRFRRPGRERPAIERQGGS